MTVGFNSYVLSTSEDTLNIKVQFDCRGFYDMTPVVLSSNPDVAQILDYDVPNHRFRFIFQPNQVAIASVQLTGLVLNPPYQAVPIAMGSGIREQFWSVDTVLVNGLDQQVITIGALKVTAANELLPDIVCMQVTALRYNAALGV